ncbi:MAG: Uncharacterized protein G01um101416_165 [Microgenomates group bacterium Gr01-1014_16]|nr:MAG: Uncharacterized protein G01um101416_165 [Microgenomates group bacterium Gr01-1014_16]
MTAHPFIATLYRNRIALCSPTIAQPLELKFSDASIKDLEIVNQSELENQVKAFGSARQLHPGELIFVLTANVVFEKDLSKIPRSDRSAQIQAFLDSIPLSSISHKIFRVQNAEKLIVLNRNLHDGLKKAFEAVGFSVSAVIPGVMLGDIGVQESTTAESCRVISKKIDFIRANSFLSDEGNFHQKETKFLKKYQLAVVVFFILAVAGAVLAAVFTLRPAPRSKPTPTLTPKPTTHNSQPTPLPTAPAEASPSALTVQILNSSGTPGLASKIQKQLTPLGYTNIIVGNSTVLSSPSSVLFSSRVSPALRQSLLQLLQISSARDNPAPQFDIIITLGKQSTP